MTWVSLKTLQEKDKILLPSISPTPTMFFTLSKKILIILAIYPSTTLSRLLTTLRKGNFLKILQEKEKMVVIVMSSFSHNVFCPFESKFEYFPHLFCCPQMLSIWTSLRIVQIDIKELSCSL